LATQGGSWDAQAHGVYSGVLTGYPQKGRTCGCAHIGRSCDPSLSVEGYSEGTQGYSRVLVGYSHGVLWVLTSADRAVHLLACVCAVITPSPTPPLTPAPTPAPSRSPTLAPSTAVPAVAPSGACLLEYPVVSAGYHRVLHLLHFECPSDTAFGSPSSTPLCTSWSPSSAL
jgi:hypothetical protein